MLLPKNQLPDCLPVGSLALWRKYSKHCGGLGIKYFFILSIRLYQLVLSPIVGPACRFYPSCSAYAIEAISRYGTVKGGVLAIKRILRCHPFNPGGVDPVP
jgi:putative membrane protein insertion efficiency factor